jgi:glyoxylase-like metal-dependent hydrolase (beta-lactamase superfamily II)
MSQEPLHTEQVADDIIRIPVRSPTLPPATHTNSYAVACDGGWLLVDSGACTDEGLSELLRVCRDTLDGRVTALLLSHHHPDHVCGAPELAAALSIPVWAHANTWNHFSQDFLSAAQRCVWTPEMGTLYGLPIIFTPGHASGHIVVQARSGGVLAADLIAGTGTILIDPEDGDMGDYLDSLQRVRDMQAPVLFPAHGPEIRDPEPWLNFYISHRRTRESRVLQAVTADPQPLAVIAALAYQDAPGAPDALTHRSTLAHLLHLQRQGLVQVHETEWCLM